MRAELRQRMSGVLSVLLVVTVTVPAWSAERILVEGEDFGLYGSHDLGGMPIAALFCTGASGYYAANGLDVPGEWILLKVDVPDAGCYSSKLAYQAAYDDDVNLRVRMIDAPAPDDEILVDYRLTGGWGFG
jgi:hypothetical protein